MSDDNVKSLFGGPVVRRVADADTVTMLREALEAAESRDVVGVSMVCLHCDEATSTRCSGILTYSVVGRLEDMKRRMLSDLE